MTKNPAGALTSFIEAANSAGNVRDAIFCESFVSFLEKTYPCTNETTVEENVKALAIKLAEASPNPEAGYAGNPKVLKE